MQALAERFEDSFDQARETFAGMVDFLGSRESLAMTHSELERLMEKQGRELMRQMLQAHLKARGPAPAVEEVRDAEGSERESEHLHQRSVATVFGDVRLERLGYRNEGQKSLHPVDGELNVPPELYSLEVRHRAAWQAASSSFEEARREVEASTGATVPKRQLEELVGRAGNAEDFEQFYATRPAASIATGGTVQVITSDAKGVVMRHEDLREATRKAAEQSRHKLDKRLSRGEKRNRKRMASVVAVYNIEPYVRTPEQIAGEMAPMEAAPGQKRPRPQNKRVWASVEKPPEDVIKQAFDEAERQDPKHKRTWVGLADGNKEQLSILRKLARRRGIALTIVLDIIHVIEYLWKAAYVFHPEGSSEAQQWVSERLLAILKGRAGYVAGGIARSATRRRIARAQRKAADVCTRYLLNNKAYLRYDRYLAAGLPIATGVIEGACRHLVRARMEISGARWSLKGAEAVLRLRALRANGDFDEYWRFHEARELQRNHLTHYADGRLPLTRNRHLSAVK